MGSRSGQRNCFLDFLKLIFALIVMISHTSAFADTEANEAYITLLGWFPVHFFFAVSGYFMVVEADKRNSELSPAKDAFFAVIKRFKGFALQYWTALALFVIVICIMTFRDFDSQMVFLSRLLFDIFPLSAAIFGHCYIGGHLWYISAMLVMMLPLFYLLFKDRDRFVYVIAPLLFVLSTMYLVQYGTPYREYNGDIDYAVLNLVRALNGLCMGSCAFIMAESIRKVRSRLVVTVIEALSWIAVLLLWTRKVAFETRFAGFILLIIGLGATLSGVSYTAQIFDKGLCRKFGSLSLAVYLNHYLAKDIVLHFFDMDSYIGNFLIMLAVTVILIVVYYIAVYLLKKSLAKRREVQNA